MGTRLSQLLPRGEVGHGHLVLVCLPSTYESLRLASSSQDLCESGHRVLYTSY